MSRSSLKDLEEHLYMALERLQDERLVDEQIDAEARRARAVAEVANQVLRVKDTLLRAYQIAHDTGTAEVVAAVKGETPRLVRALPPAGNGRGEEGGGAHDA
jgi:hypothetical protein